MVEFTSLVFAAMRQRELFRVWKLVVVDVVGMFLVMVLVVILSPGSGKETQVEYFGLVVVCFGKVLDSVCLQKST